MVKLLMIGIDALGLACRSGELGPPVDFRSTRTAQEGLGLIAPWRPDLVVLGPHPPDECGPEVLRQLRRDYPEIPVVAVTPPGETEPVIEAIKLGAYDAVCEPVEADDLARLITQVLEARHAARAEARTPPARIEVGGDDALVGRCPAMQGVYKAIGRACRQDVIVLILGESGTGKELVARAIHRHGRRCHGPFLPINSAAIPEPLLESELFGHERGAFTGASTQRAGKFELCDSGVLFLDEVGDMSTLTQTKLLRVVQDQRFERVGGNETVQADVQLIAATNRDLRGLVKSGGFRGDLFYRLNVFTIELPPLRERGHDLALIARHFLEKFARATGGTPREMSREVFEVLSRHSWPGNLRELQGVLRQAAIQAKDEVIMPGDVPAYLTRAAPPQAPRPDATPDWKSFVRDRVRDGSNNLYAESLAYLERELITRVLRKTAGNQSRAAKILGITRGCLRSKVRALGLSIGSVVIEPESTAYGREAPPGPVDAGEARDAAIGAGPPFENHRPFSTEPSRAGSWTPSPNGNVSSMIG